MNDEEIKTKIVDIIYRHTGRLPEVKIFLFGSRAAGQHTIRSDFDIGLESATKIPLATLAEIRGELEQLPLLPKIDLVDFKRVSPELFSLLPAYAGAMQEAVEAVVTACQAEADDRAPDA